MKASGSDLERTARSQPPVVGIVVVDYDGGDMTLRCLERLMQEPAQEFKFRLVVVDNASKRPILDEVRSRWPVIEILRSSRNLGFAGGCNLAMRELRDVDFVALLNNDAVAEPGWLVPLIARLQADPDLGAASPKMLFADAFIDVELSAHPDRRRADRREVAVRCSGASSVDGRPLGVYFVDGFWGPEYGSPPENVYQWAAPAARLLVATPGATAQTIRLRLGADRRTVVAVKVGTTHEHLVVGPRAAWHALPFDAAPRDIVNNLGVVVREDGYGVDRGYLEPDDGRYDNPAEIDAWSGGAVLLRREYLDDIGLFDERLFLYYEDLELSLRGRARGWRYAYEPCSVVRHAHSATAGLDSRMARFFNERNRLLVLARHGSIMRLAREAVRFALVTVSYGWRDVAVALLNGRRPRPVVTADRIKAFLGFLRHAPAMLASRRRVAHAGPGRGPVAIPASAGHVSSRRAGGSREA